MNPSEVSDAIEELVLTPFDSEEFAYGFAAATGNAKATVSKLRPGKRSLNRSKLPRAVLLSKKFYYAPAELGDFEGALEQLRADKNTAKHKPAILITTDGVDLVAEHLASGEMLRCPYSEMHHHFGFFLPAAGMTRYKAAEENEVDVKATGKLAKLYDALLRKNPGWADEARRHDLNQFMTRLVFCFFAEDVGIFSKDQFTRLVVNHAGEKGAEAHIAIVHAFEAMNRPRDVREDLPTWTHELEYVNGGLFADYIDCPEFDKIAWGYFQDAARLDWQEINPDIFGSMIQSIADPKTRGELGMHYTSVPNILKVLGPLFLDDLDASIEKAWDKPNALKKVLERLGRIHVFDPACGSGNFLVVAYRQLREREMRILARLGDLSGQTQVQMWSSISLANFHGIELTDFGAETAKLALFIAEYQSNAAMAELFGAAAEALPLRDGGHIVRGNALRLDWEEVCPPPRKDEEVYIAGNPPFLGKAQQESHHKADKDHLFSSMGRNYKAFDYVVGWFYKAGQYIEERPAQAALVATNSIAQGDAASTIWSLILDDTREIGFAHRTFKWRNNAAANAAVMCVIIGIRNQSNSEKRLFDGDIELKASHINSYLLDMSDVDFQKSMQPIFDLPPMTFGEMPRDGGNLLMDKDEKHKITERNPDSDRFLKKFLGSEEVINGKERWCVWIDERSNPDLLPLALSIPDIANRVRLTQEFRSKSTNSSTRDFSTLSHRFVERRSPPSFDHAILIPSITSERRPYLPVDLVGSDVISSNKNFVVYDGPLWVVSIIASAIHRAWIDTVCGKWKSDFQYSNTLGWNTFPVPRFTEAQLEALTTSARMILKTRYMHHPKTIADLYDPAKMPEDLREVHRQNDELLETMYIGRPFKNDTERLEKLFKLYAARVEKLKTEAA